MKSNNGTGQWAVIVRCQVVNSKTKPKDFCHTSIHLGMYLLNSEKCGYHIKYSLCLEASQSSIAQSSFINRTIHNCSESNLATVWFQKRYDNTVWHRSFLAVFHYVIVDIFQILTPMEGIYKGNLSTPIIITAQVAFGHVNWNYSEVKIRQQHI